MSVDSDRLLKAELHMHTMYSPDCSLTLEAIVAAAKRRDLDVLAITDHNSLQGAIELQRQAPFAVIVSEEIRCLEGELIGYFLQEEIPQRLRASETARLIKEQGGVVCVPHPFDRLRRSRLREDTLGELVREGLVDVIEIQNSRVLVPNDNYRARHFASEHGLLASGGSDAHSAAEIGRTYMELPPFEDAAAFRDALRSGRVVGRLSSPLVHAVTIWEKWRRRRPRR